MRINFVFVTSLALILVACGPAGDGKDGHGGPGMGKFALFTDPEGRMVGLWKAKK